IHAFAEQVLPETTALALEHVTQRFQRAIACTGDGATMTTVVEQRVHSFLQHALLVSDDDFRRLEREQVLQPVIPVDDATIEIVQVRRRKTTTFEWHQRT